MVNEFAGIATFQLVGKHRSFFDLKRPPKISLQPSFRKCIFKRAMVNEMEEARKKARHGEAHGQDSKNGQSAASSSSQVQTEGQGIKDGQSAASSIAQAQTEAMTIIQAGHLEVKHHWAVQTIDHIESHPEEAFMKNMGFSRRLPS